MHKMMNITNFEPYGSARACNKHLKFLLKGECCKQRVKCIQPFLLKGECIM